MSSNELKYYVETSYFHLRRDNYSDTLMSRTSPINTVPLIPDTINPEPGEKYCVRVQRLVATYRDEEGIWMALVDPKRTVAGSEFYAVTGSYLKEHCRLLTTIEVEGRLDDYKFGDMGEYDNDYLRPNVTLHVPE